MADNKKSQYLIQIGEESQLWDSDKLTKNSEKLASSHPEAQVFQLDDYDMSEAPSSDASYIVTIGGESQQWDSTKFGKNKDKLYAKYPDAKVQKVSAWRNPYLKSESEMAKENLDAFRSENGAFLDDFESREATEQAIANKNTITGIVAQPAEGTITGEERGRYLELHKQEEDLKKAYYNSPDVVNARLQRGESINTMQKDIEKTLFQMENDNPEAFKEMRQASIKRSNPRTALMASRPLSADAKEIQADYSNYVVAQNLLKDAVKINNAPSKYDSSNGFVNFMKGMGDTFSDIDFWSAGLTEIAGNMKLRGVLSTVQEKLGNLNNLSEEDVDAVLTDSEKKVLAAFVINTDAQYDRAEDMSRALQAGQGAAESLGFMAEFILTGGVAKGAAELAESAANKILRGYLGKLAGKFSKTAVGKYAGGLAKDAIGAAARTLVLPSTYRNMSEKAVQIKEDPETGERRLASVGEFAAEGFADSFIEALAEGGRVGAIGGFFGDVLSSVKPAKKLIDMARKSDIADLYRTISNSEALSVLRAGGWHGIGEEYLEEWYGAALRTLTNLDPEALKDFASVDNQLITLTSFLPMTLIGGSVSTGQVLHSKKDLEKKAAVLKSAMIDRGYTEDQANLLVDNMRTAPMQNISDTFTPMVNKMAQQENGNAPELMKAVSDFAMASARMQSYGIAYEEQEARQRRQLLSDMEEQIGRFWQEDAEGNRTVELATAEDGTPVYILGREKYEEVTEDGVITPMNPEYMAVDMQGNVRFVNNVTDSQTMSIDDYLNTRLIERRGAEEEARIAQETEQYQNDIKSQIVLNQTVLNMGTQENPINGLVVGLSADGVTVQTNEGVFSLTWNEVGNKLAMPNPVQTDAQIDEAEAANLDAQQNAREAMLDEQFDNPLAAEEEIAEGEAAEAAVEEVTYNYPLKKDGSVDGNALWNENVREWIRWNNQRIAEKYGVSDNGMDSLNYLQNQISSLEKSAAQISSSKNKETDLDKRMTLEDNEIAVNRRLAELRGILAEMTGETAAPEAVVAEEAQLQDIAESPAVPEQDALPEQEKDRVTMEIESLMDGTLDDSEIEAYISNNLKKAQKALVSHNKKSPKIGTDKEQYLQDKKRHQEKAEQLQHDIDFWEEVKTSMEVMRGASVPEQSELVNKEYDLTPMTPAELVADYFGSILSNAPKIRKESFLKHTGYSEEDAKKLSFFLRKNSGITMEAMADLIVEYDSEHGYNILDHNDPTAGLNALLDAFSQVTSHWDMFNMIKNNRKAQAEYDAKSLHDAMIYAIEQATHMSYEEYKTYQEVSAREIYDAALTDDQINELYNIFAEDYYDYEDYRLNNEGETPGNEADVIERTDGIHEEGDAVLQGEQSAVSGESTGAEEESEDSAIAGGDGNAYAPGDAGADSAERAEDVGDIPDDIWFSTEETPASQQPKGESQNGFEFNENGVCTNPITIELPSFKKGWANGNDVRIAEFNGKWGYSINVHYSTGGMGWAVAKRDCVLNTKEEAFTKAYEDLVRYRASHAKESGLKDLDNLIKYLETEYPFVKEAAAPKVEDKYKFEDGVATNPEVLEMPGTAKGEANRIYLAERNGRWGYAAEILMDNDTWGSTPKIQIESLRYDSKEDAIYAALNYFRFYKEMKKDAGSKALDAFVKYIEDNYLSDYTPPKKKERKTKAPAKAQQTETAVQGSLFGEEEPSAQAEAGRYNAMLEENNLPDVLYLVDAYSTGDEQYIRAISGQMREHMSKMSTAQLQQLIDNFDEFFPVNSQYDDSRRGHALAKAFITDYAKGLIDVVNKATSAVTAKTEGEIAAERENKRRQPLRDRAKSWEDKLGVKVNVIENIDGVTNQQVVEHINNGGKPQGWYESDGSVSIYLPNVKNVSVIDKTVIHEVVAHKGMRQLLGEDKYAELCDNVFAAMSEDKQAEYLKKPGVNGDPRKAADEYIAYLAEDVNYDKSTWEKVVDALMNFLAELGIMKQADIKNLDAFLSNLLVESYNRLSAQAQKQKADAKAETKPAAKKAKASRSKVETKIEDFGEKIGGARKDAARSRIRDAAKLSRTDLNKLNDPDKILSRKQIIKYVSEGQMTVEDGQMLLAANMAVRGESYIQKDVALTKYRDLAVAWEKGEDLTFEINDQDVETIYETYSQKIKDSIPELRDRIRKSFTISLMNNYHGYLATYKELNYPVENRDLKGTYVRYGLHDSKHWVVSGPNARRGWPKASMAEAINYIKNNFPVIEASNKDAKKNEEGKETFGHLHVVKSRYGGYRIKSRNIPGDIYISGKDFVTKKLAEAYLKENAEKLMEIEARMSEALMGSNIGMVERQGKDYRNGKDVTPQDFMDTFGFRGVEFGNWVPQAERQMYLNKTYDAIMDFCDVVGISPKAFSLGGRLGLAFGARGKSSALAHYEPMKEVINLTRMKGAGSLAHEWFHALDNFLAKQKSGNTSDMATATRDTVREEVASAFGAFVRKMNSLAYTTRSRRAGEYWGEVWERAARLFENYVYNELGGRGTVSPLLVRKDVLFNEGEGGADVAMINGTESASWWPYPSARENEEMKPYFDALFDAIQEQAQEDGNVVLYRSKPEPDENVAGLETLVERTYRTSGAFSFSGKDQIESRDDVAFIFRQLEDSAVENSFLVFVKNGVPTILHVGMGDISSTFIDGSVVLPAYKDFGADKVYMVHNHPSGSLYASMQDIKELAKIHDQLPGVPVEGIIIDTVSGEYAVFNDLGDISQRAMPNDEAAVEIEVLSFDRNVFAPDYKSKINERKIQGPQDIAAFLSAHRLGQGTKVGALLLNRQNVINGNLVTNDNEVSMDNVDELASQIAEAANRTGSSSVILFGDFDYSDRALRSLSKTIKSISGETVNMLDVVRLEGNHTQSLVDETLPSRNTLNDGVRFREENENQAIFVSNAAKAVEAIKQEKATPEQWLKMIEKSGGLKAGEDKWMGLSDWLKASDKKTLTKQEVLDFINENMIIIEEQHYVEEIDFTDEEQKQIDALNDEFLALRKESEDAGEWIHDAGDIAYQQMADKYGDDFTLGFGVELGELYVANLEAASAITGVEVRPERVINDTRMSYTTRGLVNNHEIALTVPTIDPYYDGGEIHFSDAGDGRAIAWIRFGDAEAPTQEYAKLLNEVKRLKEVAIELYEEFGGRTNELAEVEARRREIEDEMRAYKNPGYKVLVIDEIQSQRHQKGREKGYKSDVGLSAEQESLAKALDAKYARRGELIRERENENENELTRLAQIDIELDEVKNVRDYDRLTNEADEIRARRENRDAEIASLRYEIRDLEREQDEFFRRKEYQYSIAVPDAPFEKNWAELAMKRMLRYAAENGYDVIAWTKGDQQNARYGLSKVVDHIQVGIDFSKEKESSFRMYLTNGDNHHVGLDKETGLITFYNENTSAIGKPLSDLVGKELADKILSAKDYQIFRGVDLELSEGMKGFYDKMLPAFMNKYGKKWGVKVEDINLPNLGKSGYTMHSVPVTEEMKASVMEGQVMFREREIDEDVQNEMNAIKASAIVMGNFMKAPNGKTSKLTEEQWLMVRTKRFKSWFGDWENDPENASKVVDENGEPKVVYHGTGNEFYTFRDTSDSNELGAGYYFSDSYEMAERYATDETLADNRFRAEAMAFDIFTDEMGHSEADYDDVEFTDDYNESYYRAIERLFGNGHVKSVFLNIKNPRILSRNSPDYDPYLRYGFNHYNEGRMAKRFNDGVIDEMFEERHSGLTGIQYVAFNPSQIKSATGNTGEFSSENEDIRFREREENESVMDFYQSELDAYKAKYNEITPMAIADINSKKSVEDAMGQKISFLLYLRMRHLYSTGRMKAVHFPNGRIAIFADKKITDSKIIELQAFHETIHEIGLEDVGKYMWENPGVNTKRARLKEFIRKRYRKANHHSEMAAYVISECMCFGKMPQLLNTLDDASRTKVEDALKTIGYDTEQESRIRLSGTGRQLGTSDVVRNTADEGTAESGEAGRKRPRVTWTKTLDATPTKDVVAEGLKLSDRQMTELAGNLFAAFPAYVRKQITDSMNGNPLKLQEAIFQISTSLAEKDAFTDEDIAIADIIAREVQAMIGTPLKRPLRISEALWMLYDGTHPTSAYDLVGAAKKAQVKDNLGFSERKLKEKQEFTLYREATQAEIDAMERSMTAADIYNRDVTSAIMRLRESFQDMYRSAQKMVDAIVQKTGKAVKSFEDIMLALNQLSSKNLADKGKYLRDFLMPMWNAVLAFKKNGYDIDDVIRYVMLKHGLERNDVLAKRDARYYYKQAYEKKLRDIESNDSLDEAKKQQKKDKAKADYDFHLASIESGSDAKYRELRERDYGAVMALYAEYDEIADRMPGETVEQFNARQKAARHLKYTDLAVAEAEAEREVKAFEDKNGSLCDKLWKRINAATKETLKHQYEHNVISKQTYDNVSGMFSFYVPLRGFKEDTAEDIYSYYGKDVSTDFANPIIKTKGRTTLAESPFGWIGSMAESAIQMDNKNDAKMRLYYFVSNRPDQNLLTLQKTWYKKVGEDEEGRSIWEASYPNITPDMDYNETRQEIERHNAEMKALAASGMATQKKKELSLGNSVVNISDKAKPEHAISVLINGEEQVMYVNGNPRAAQAINGMLNIDKGDSGIYRVLGQKITRWMSQMNTSYNPAFWISNYERDLLFTIMNVNIKEDKAYQNQFWSSYVNPAKVTKLLRKYEKGTLDMNNPLERMYKEFADNGGVTGFTVLANNEEYDKLLEKYARDVERSKFIKGAQAALGAIQDFAEGVEQASRFAAYMTSRKMGRPVEQAIGDAKEVTVNFNRKGSGKAISWEETANLTYGKWIDAHPKAKWAARVLTMLVSSMAPAGRSVYMFFNASIQGLRSFATLAKRYPGKTAMWAGAYFGMGFALVALNHMINSMLGGDDDDYLDIPDWERRNNIRIGGNGFYLKWALPQEARPFYAMADIIYNKMVGRSPDEDIVEEITRAMLEVLPVNPMGEGGLAQAVVPSALSPLYEVWQNTDYKGMPLYSESYWSSGDAPKYDKAYSGTGKVFVEISRILNNVSGGDYAEGGKINVHPAAIEHIIEGYGGGTVTFFNQVLKTLTGNYFEGEWTVRNTPFLNRVLTINDDRYRNAHTTELFRYYEEVAKDTKRIYNVYKNNDDIDKLDELMEEDRYEIMQIYERYRKQEEKYDDLIRDSVDTDEKKELMAEQDELRREMIKEISEL